MIRAKTFPKVLLLLAAFVFFSANTIYLIEDNGGTLQASPNKRYDFDFGDVRKGPYLNLKSALLVNYDNGEVLYSKNAKRSRPIASISKLVAAMVILDAQVDLNRTEKITKADARRSSRSRLKVGFELTLSDLLHAALLSSDNRATRALARATCGSIVKFVDRMNQKVQVLGLDNTVFFDPAGLDARNVSNANEVAKILHYAYDYPEVARITALKEYRVKIVNRKNTYRQMVNTNRFIHSPYKVLTGKTGYIQASDYCLTTLLKNKRGQRLTLVVLGVPGDKLRFKEARKLADWGFKQIS